MAKNEENWRSFWIDVNCFCGRITSREDWERAVQTHREISGFGVDYLLEARQSSSGMFIFGYHLYHTGVTLREWAEKNGMDLSIEGKDFLGRENVVNLFVRR